ncbi:MAG: hypothetical protein KJ048_11635 [Dehalococcoidia bacterium]|nr:hypothetical protein [Dehalococcoidia bacterium]
MPDPTERRWLVICFTVPAKPSALRVATWRTLKQLGAVALGTSVYTVPDRPDVRELLDQLAERINGGGGLAVLLLAQGLRESDEAMIAQRVAGSRSEDYLQVAKSARRFVEHVDRETATRDFRFAEVESLEEELEKVRRQLQRVVARDYFESPAREEAQASVLAAEAAFETYVERASEQGEP